MQVTIALVIGQALGRTYLPLPRTDLPLPRTDLPLPRTGSESRSQGAAAMMLIMFGMALLWWTRRDEEDLVVVSPPWSPAPESSRPTDMRIEGPRRTPWHL